MADYFKRPIRSDRTGHEYGHTRLHNSPKANERGWSAVEFTLMTIVVSLVLWAIIL